MSAAPEIMEVESREIALRPAQGGQVTLFGTDDPVEFATKVSKIADVLTKVINDKKLFSVINGRKFVGVEGWTTVGSMVGIFPVLRWTHQIEVDGMSGWEARVEAVTLNGAVVGAAEAMCLKGESKTWTRTANDNSVRSMAQTRAASKALRQPLDFLVKMAGFVATPAEEMDGGDSEPAAGGQQSRATAAHPEEARATPAPAAAPTPSIEELYQEAVDLATTLWLREHPADEKDAAEAAALARLDKVVQDKWGVALDKLNYTNLERVVLSYRVKATADI